MGEAMGPMFEGLAQASEALDAAPYHWVKMETIKLQERIKARSAMFLLAVQRLMESLV